MSVDRSSYGITRRQLIQAAGGVTFMAFAPASRGVFATTIPNTANAPVLPLFTALPYLQPGGQSSGLHDDREAILIAWQTNSVGADFTVEYGIEHGPRNKADITRLKRMSGDVDDTKQRNNYVATLASLKLNTRYQYRVHMNKDLLLEGFFTTRKPRGVKSRFVAFGDNSFGEVSDRAIAHQAYAARPDFIMNTGDNVYENGLDNEYARYFFSVYNADVSGPRIGAPLLRSVPFYSVIANHDVHDKGPNKGPAADFDIHKDCLAFFTNFHFPLNGPQPAHITPTMGDPDAIAHFAACAGERFPKMANYSFDYADAHFLCLDSNVYVDPTHPDLQSWIVSDLKSTDAPWKFVVYHHPAFNAGYDHYTEQHMRALSPIFEQNGVDLVLHGHEHTYQRTRPLRFTPTDLAGARAVPKKNRLVPGKFEIDRTFDGKSVTKPQGILYITTGAGGKSLYDPDSNDNPKSWLHAEDNNADYVVRFVSDRHSLTVFDMDRNSLHLTQIDEWGNTIDQCHIAK